MTATSPAAEPAVEALRKPKVDGLAVAGLALAAAIAWFEPFDRLFAAATFGLPALRAVAIVALAIFGAHLGGRAGLQVHGRGSGAIPVALLTSALVAVGCALVDLAFRPVLHARYAEVITTAPLALRTAAYMLRAFNENILYRLFLGSLLATAFGRLWPNSEGRPSTAAIWCGFAVSQALNVWANVTGLAPLSAMALAHDALRYLLPGLVWSWLYWRKGFLANEVASTTVHLVFQPLAGALLAR